MKKFFRYIGFFFHHASNWSLPMAVFSLYHTIRGEKKYGLNSFVASDLRKLTIKKGDIKKSSRYEAVNYYMLENLLENFRRRYPLETRFLDAGCGKGRAMVVAAHYGFLNLTGIDFAKELCVEAEKNLMKIRKEFPEINYKIFCEDIIDHHITNETVFFLFNPFDKDILGSLLVNIEESILSFPRPIYIIYASPLHEDVLLSLHYDIVYRVKKMHYLEGLIAERR